MPTTRSAFASPAARSLTAWAIVHDGQHAGTVLTYRADSGGVTATVSLWAGPWAQRGESTNGRASGWGYDKGSAAVASALDRNPALAALKVLDLAGRGMPAIRSAFETAGYQVFEVLA